MSLHVRDPQAWKLFRALVLDHPHETCERPGSNMIKGGLRISDGRKVELMFFPEEFLVCVKGLVQDENR